MVNLPETLFVDPAAAALSGGSANNYARAAPQPTPINLRSATVEQLISLLGDPQYREDALYILTKKKSRELALQLWNSFNTVYILLQEVMSLYKLLSPPKLTMAESTRVCNALALFQCIATHPDTRMGLVRAKIPVYLYPFVKSTDKQRPFEFLKLTSLGVIGALVKEEDTNTPQVIHFLLETEVFPLCLGCMEQGNELTQTVATYIISKILMQSEAISYCALFAERFFSVGCLLATMVNKLPAQPPLQLLKHIISCFLSLAEVPRLVGCHDALERCFPARLSDPQFIRVAYGDPSTKRMLEQLLREVHAGPWSRPKPVGEVQGGSISRR